MHEATGCCCVQSRSSSALPDVAVLLNTSTPSLAIPAGGKCMLYRHQHLLVPLFSEWRQPSSHQLLAPCMLHSHDRS